MTKLTTAILTCFVSLASSSLLAMSVYAASPAPSPVTGLSISPLRSELTIDPGTAQSGVLTLANNSPAPMTVTLDAEKFTVTDEKYDYKFTTNTTITKWVSFSQNNIVLQPGKNQKVTYTVGVPVDGDPGAKYLALFATTATQGNNGSIKSEQRVASLIYLTVSGTVSANGNLVAIRSPWLTSGQDKWSMDIQNSGNNYFRSQYGVTVQSLFGGAAVGSYKTNSLILSASVRSVAGILPEPRWPGLYKAVYTATMGSKPAVTQTRLFLYAPLWAVGALAILILMIISTIFYIRSLRQDKS